MRSTPPGPRTRGPATSGALRRPTSWSWTTWRAIRTTRTRARPFTRSGWTALTIRRRTGRLSASTPPPTERSAARRSSMAASSRCRWPTPIPAASRNSEATRTFDSVQDWTGYGVKTLTLYFYGQAANYEDDSALGPAGRRERQDRPGRVRQRRRRRYARAGRSRLDHLEHPAEQLPGITLAKIKAMTIGVGPGAGSGTLYIDDIRLYPAVTTTVTRRRWSAGGRWTTTSRTAPAPANNGTIVGAPTYVGRRKIGASLKLKRPRRLRECGNAAPLNMTDAVTVAAWIKPRTFANAAYQTFISKGDHAYVLPIPAATCCNWRSTTAPGTRPIA